jgi:hypothetical protein
MKPTLRKFIHIMLSVLMLCLVFLPACSSGKPTKIKANTGNVISAKTADARLHTTDVTALKKVASSGLLELYIDEISLAVAVKETTNGKMWLSLPAESNTYAGVLSLNVLTKNGILYLNSQDNSVAMGGATFEQTENGVKISYVFTLDENSEKIFNKEKDAKAAQIKAEANFYLTDGNFYFSADCSNLTATDGLYIEKLAPLPYFGSTFGGGAEEYFLLPDGPGALMHVNSNDHNTSFVNLPVYGADQSAIFGESVSDYPTVIMPVFGVKSADNAFTAIIEDGDALAEVQARRATASTPARVGAYFRMRSSNSLNKKSYISEQYDGNIKLCYRFITGKSANYSGMARAAREQLIREGILSTKTVNYSDKYPFNLSIIGAGKKKTGFYHSLTKIDQAQDLATILKGKGIDSINMRYIGLLSGGIVQHDSSRASVLTILGGKSSLEKLSSYLSRQKSGLYIDVNVLTSGGLTGYLSSNCARTSSGDVLSFENDNPLYPYVGAKSFFTEGLALAKLEIKIVDLLTNSKNISFTGFCINDAGRLLYSDFGDGYINRQEAKRRIASHVQALATQRGLMVDTGNFYLVKNADIISNLPSSTFYSESDAYESVPAAPIILHGIVDYSGRAVNLTGDRQKAMLKSIEYGMLPAYEWVFDSESTLYYNPYITEAVDFYNKSMELLSDLRTSAITNSYTVQKGVRCTQYDTGAVIYVNYNTEPVTINEITIPAQDCIRVS